MRVIHFMQSFSPLSETFIYDYVKELERQGVDSHVVTLSRKNSETRPFPKVKVMHRPSRWHPKRLWYRALAPLGIGEARTSDWPQIREKLQSYIRRMQPDVVHAHFGPAGVLIAPVAEAAGVPLVVTFYGYDISQLPRESFWTGQYTTLWSQVDAVTVLSEEMKERAQQLGAPAEQISILHLSRNLDQFLFRVPTRSVRRLLFVGRLVPKKAPLEAIQAIERACAQGSKLTLDLLGEGPLYNEAARYIQKQDLSDRVTLHGRVSNDAVAQHMHDADAFILPSKTAPNGDREGTPTVLVEAQATGLPCVSTLHAGIPEMIPESHHDLLAPEGDVQALAAALCSLAGRSVNDLEQMAKRGRQKVERDFSLSGEVEKLSELYASC